MGTASDVKPSIEGRDAQRFTLIRPLGSGGFGAVYEAIDGASGQREVDAALARQDRLAGVSAGLMILSAGSITLYFAL